MKVLTVNCGSSTLKYRVVDAERSHPPGTPLPSQADGAVDRIGGDTTHGDALRDLVETLADRVALEDLGAVAHRIVHGGTAFVAPTVVDRTVLAELERLSDVAPLHNRPAIDAMKAARDLLVDCPSVAVFDTAFHHDLPPRAAHYAIRPDLAERHGVRRFGFHGLAHRWMSERFATRNGVAPADTRIVTLQLGNGCSAAAVAGGRSIDTTMGLTPLEGLMMGTRSGNVDPALVDFLAEREGVSTADVLDLLNHDAGLLGVSGRSADMRDVLAAEATGDERAALAIEMFCYRVTQVVGAYDAVLGGASAIVFGGGIGEHAPAIRALVCAGFEHRGLQLDPARNEAAVGQEATISAEGSGIVVEVIPVDEATPLAIDTVRLLASKDA